MMSPESIWESLRGTVTPVYGGKLVAVMDRSHPRDLFDVIQLLAHEGITPGILRAIVIYPVSHNRPVHEVLFPSMRHIGQEYECNFKGMTTEPVELAALLAARERMVQELQGNLDANERRSLLSRVAGRPEWPLLGIAHAEHRARDYLESAQPRAAGTQEPKEIRRALAQRLG